MELWLFALALAAAPSSDQSFEARFASLAQSPSGAIEVRPRKKTAEKSGPILVANERTLFVPATLGAEDVAKVVSDNQADLAACYEAALEKDPELTVRIIIDFSVKKSGRVAELAISPKRENDSVLGACLLSRIPRWQFPEFTGEVSEGVTQEVLNLAIPLTFAK
ncbi:MAG: AgmX/PglI C-terminal domain-containing protein [Deltaproteobacteria bacterium]|nr:AgmX/PglI C-terminal domain-containing protein [Deltaproteobacteria bacterium]